MIIDSHIHIAMNKLFSKKSWNGFDMQQKVGYLREILSDYKKNNIFALRDGGDNLFISKLARDVAAEIGIIYKTPIFALYKKEHYGSLIGRSIDGICDFKEEFKILLKNNPDHLKIALTGIVNFSKFGDVGEVGFTHDELKYIVSSAKEHELPVMVHANGCEGVDMAIEAGVDTIEHGFLISTEQLQGMADKGITWVPTLSPLGNILDAKDEKLKDQLSIIKKVYDKQVENIKKADKIGVRIALGSDAGAYRVGHINGILDEIRHFNDIGFDREKVLKMCSENGRNALKI